MIILVDLYFDNPDSPQKHVSVEEKVPSPQLGTGGQEPTLAPCSR